MSSIHINRGPVRAPYEIGFYPDYIPMIEEGSKWMTYRNAGPFDYLKPGDSIELKEHGTHRLIGKTSVVSINFMTLGELSIDCPGHESYQSKDHQREVLSGYAGKPLEDSELFIVIEFKPLSERLANENSTGPQLPPPRED